MNEEKVIEFNLNKFNKNDYSETFSTKFNKQLSVSQEPDIEYDHRNNYLVVSSGSRDTSVYPSSSNFVLDLDNEYRNIVHIELIAALIPDKNDVKLEPFLLLNIKELNTSMDSNDKYIDDSFAMLQIAPPVVAGSFIQVDKRTFENTALNYHTPKARLSRMTISITNTDGEIFEFSPTPGGDGSVNKAYQCHFVFKIITLDTSRKSINQRNVY